MASNSPLGSAREAGRLCSWGGGQLSGWTRLFHSETAPEGGLREETGSVDTKTMDPTHRWYGLGLNSGSTTSQLCLNLLTC